MRKMLIGLLLMSVALQVPASSGQTQIFVFDGSQSTKQLTLSGEKSHTEYQTQQVAHTCYRSVVAGYRRHCQQVAERICPSVFYYKESEDPAWQRPLPPGPRPPPSNNPPSRPPPNNPPPHRPPPNNPPPHRPPPNNPPPHRPPPHRPPPHNPPPHRPPPHRPPPHNPPPHRPPPHNPPPHRPPSRPCYTHYRTVCRDVPYYRDEAYTCYKTVQTAVQVKDYDVLASVLFNFGPVPSGIQPREEVSVTLNGDQLRVDVKDSRQLVLIADRQDQTQINGGVLDLGVTYNVEMVRPAEILKPLTQPMADFAIVQDVLTFTVGEVAHVDTFLPEIRIRQDGHTLIDRNLNSNEFRLVNANGRTQVIVELLPLGFQLDKTEMAELKITSKLNVSGKILNPKVMPSAKELVGRAKVKVQ